MNKPSTPPTASLPEPHEPRHVTLIIDDPRMDWIPEQPIKVPPRLVLPVLAIIRGILPLRLP